MAEHLKKADQHQLVNQWCRQFHGRLQVFLRRGVRTDADVQDLTQEVFLRLLRVENPELIEAPHAYLYRIAVHVLSEWRARERRSKLHDSDGLEGLPSDDSPHQTAEQKSQAMQLQGALSRLPANCRAALVLHTQHQLTYGQIARHLGVTERMVKRYIVKGYAGMRQWLSQATGEHND